MIGNGSSASVGVHVEVVARMTGPYQGLIGWRTKASVREGQPRTFWAMSAKRSRAKAQAWVDATLGPPGG